MYTIVAKKQLHGHGEGSKPMDAQHQLSHPSLTKPAHKTVSYPVNRLLLADELASRYSKKETLDQGTSAALRFLATVYRIGIRSNTWEVA